MDKRKYPKNWTEISRRIRFERAGGRCEGSPAYPDCRAAHGQPHPVTGSKVVLSVAHLDHDTGNNDPTNLQAMCQPCTCHTGQVRCHLTYDAKLHAAHAAQTRRQRQADAGQLELFT
ncbi:MAG: hypothetical protein GY832_20380 [Chloroflexi bacterium]|nr:hypothetical protein [Chloroflexota bacterium]